MRHRGPDASGIWIDGGGRVGFGHARLSIIDLDPAANQPMVCGKTGNVVSFNGEIYNYRAVRTELMRLGWQFRTRSDTEVLLAAYGEWGTACLQRLNGMFAFSIFDSHASTIFLARDRVGKKPLYYSFWRQRLCWASELKGLFSLSPEIPRDINYPALKEYADLNYIPGELSIYRHVQKLLPAHYAVYDLQREKLTISRYWELPAPGDDEVSEDAAAEELEELLRDAVRIRLESDVPVGAFLSGGLDSSLITALALKEKPNLVTYTAQFPIALFDETPIAARVATWIGARHNVLPVDAEDGIALEKLGYQFDEPFADSSLLPTHLVSRAIRQHVTVALSGDGGDELFAGYEHYSASKSESRWDRIPLVLRSAAANLSRLMPLGTRGKNYLRRLPYDGIERFMFMGRSPEDMRISPYASTISQELDVLPSDNYRQSILEELKRPGVGKPLTLLQLMTRLDFYSYLPDDILVKVDRASMLTSLEVRSPLLDYRIVEFVFKLPDRLRFNGVTRKYLLKKVARKYLPPDFPYERKRGFSIPEAAWFKGKWRRNVESISADAWLMSRDRISEILRIHDKSGRCGRLLFGVLMLSEFQKHWRISA
jgi:asparagine synthase (glutamine-hydrolysing)